MTFTQERARADIWGEPLTDNERKIIANVLDSREQADKWLRHLLLCYDGQASQLAAQREVIEAARESVRREATSDYKSIYEAPTRIIGPVRDALASFDAKAEA